MVSYEYLCCLQSLINLATPFNHLYERSKRGRRKADRVLLSYEILVAALMLLPATILAIVGLLRPVSANCLTHVYVPTPNI